MKDFPLFSEFFNEISPFDKIKKIYLNKHLKENNRFSLLKSRLQLLSHITAETIQSFCAGKYNLIIV